MAHNELNSHTNIEAKLIKLGNTPNVIVAGYMDMCRTQVVHKGGNYPTEPMMGSVFISFATKANKPAIARPA